MLSSRASVFCAARDLGEPRKALRSLQRSNRAFGSRPYNRRRSRTQEPAMEGLNRLVSESMARHGFDRPLDYRRLHWSRWFRCESHHSLLFVPSKSGVFAIAEEIMDLGTEVTTDASSVPPARSAADS